VPSKTTKTPPGSKSRVRKGILTGEGWAGRKNVMMNAKRKGQPYLRGKEKPKVGTGRAKNLSRTKRSRREKRNPKGTSGICKWEDKRGSSLEWGTANPCPPGDIKQNNKRARFLGDKKFWRARGGPPGLTRRGKRETPAKRGNWRLTQKKSRPSVNTGGQGRGLRDRREMTTNKFVTSNPGG